jgi:ABC-2 type transport system ATP-binding protein
MLPIPPSEPAPSAQPAIAVSQLVKRYGGRNVVDGVSFSVERGEVFAILGPNGAGKTTTVEILEGFRSADGGEVRVLGLDPARDGQALKPRLGVMLQGSGVYQQVRPLEALRHYASFFADPRPPEEVLHAVGLEHATRTPFRRLSGGEKQRLSLGLAIVGRPEVVFLDEPTAAMDPEARRATWGHIRAMKEAATTVVLTTHFMDEAEQLADRVLILAAGRQVAIGTPAELRAGQDRRVAFRTRAAIDAEALALHLGVRVLAHGVTGGEHAYTVEAVATPVLLASLSRWLSQQNVLMTVLQAGAGSLEETYLRLTATEART